MKKQIAAALAASALITGGLAAPASAESGQSVMGCRGVGNALGQSPPSQGGGVLVEQAETDRRDCFVEQGTY